MAETRNLALRVRQETVDRVNRVTARRTEEMLVPQRASDVWREAVERGLLQMERLAGLST